MVFGFLLAAVAPRCESLRAGVSDMGFDSLFRTLCDGVGLVL